ncbi:MAG: hypothetical protein SGI96_20230 [Bacteroidota bacterium]|nr:hypothetical protein [Bacteroidota bacterium]
MSKQKIVILVLSVVGLISTFLPWVKGVLGRTVVGVSGKIEYEIWLVFILFLIPLSISLLKKSEYLLGAALYGSIFPSLLATLFSLNYLTITSIDIRFGIPEGSELGLSLGPAPYIVFIIGILIPLFGFALKHKKANKI